MSLIIWSDEKYSVGIKSIDTQQKKLVDLINALHDAFMRGDREQRVRQALHPIAEYVAYHFDYEERLMEKCRFDHFRKHRGFHQRFRHEIARLIRETSTDPETVYPRLLACNREWLIDHILE